MQNRQKETLRPDSMAPDPIKQFLCWYEEAEQSEPSLPNAMTLATTNRQGKPSARMVLLKEVDERGFVFYTNYEGRKACELKENPYAALVFHWRSLSRQVRVEGAVSMVDCDESDQYFASRPRGFQVEAHASQQSQVIKDRTLLEQQFNEIDKTFAGKDVPRPKSWGGYRVVPETVEFWQEGEHRLHDRLRYRRDSAGNWMIERLAP